VSAVKVYADATAPIVRHSQSITELTKIKIMSHFVVMVIGKNVEEQLAKYDENLEMEMHVYKTKQQIIEIKKKWIEDYKNGIYADYLKDKEAYKAHCTNEKHIEYLENEFPQIMKMSDEELYLEYIKDYQEYIDEDKEEGRPARYDFDSEGNLLSIYNEKAKWDWYAIGGRWEGQLKLKEGCECMSEYCPSIFLSKEENEKRKQEFAKERRCNVAYKKDIANLDELGAFAFLRDGEWYERGEMGFWAVVKNEKDKEDWNAEFKQLLADVPDDELITMVDCHI